MTERGLGGGAVPYALALCLVAEMACGTGEDGGSTLGGAGGSGGSTSAGASGLPNVVGGSGGFDAGGGVGGSAASGGSSGFTGWTNDFFGPVPPGTACDEQLAVVDGVVEGQAVSTGYRYSNLGLGDFATHWYARLPMYGPNFLLTQAPEPVSFFDPRSDFVSGQSYPLGGWLMLGGVGSPANSVYCINPGSSIVQQLVTYASGEQQKFDLELALSLLGRCPGTPVSGSLTYCIGNATSPDCPERIVANIDGLAVDTTPGGYSGVAEADGIQDLSSFFFNGMFARLRFHETGGSVEAGLVMTNRSGDQVPRIVYCIDEAATTPVDPAGWLVQITRLSKLGECSGGPQVGAVHICAVD
jgi:hypothetical protein